MPQESRRLQNAWEQSCTLPRYEGDRLATVIGNNVRMEESGKAYTLVECPGESACRHTRHRDTAEATAMPAAMPLRMNGRNAQKV